MKKLTAPKKGDRVRPYDYDTLCGRVVWVSEDEMVCLVTWEDGSGCDHWSTSHLELVPKEPA